MRCRKGLQPLCAAISLIVSTTSVERVLTRLPVHQNQHSSSQWPTLLLHVGCVHLGRSLSVLAPLGNFSPMGDLPLKDLPLGPLEPAPPEPEPPELEPALPDAARSEIASYCWAITVWVGTVVKDVALT